MMRICAWTMGALALAAATGCGRSAISSWQTERFEFRVPSESVERLEISNPNGNVELAAAPPDQEFIEIHVERSAWGHGSDGILEALDSIEVFANLEGTTQKIGWRHRHERMAHSEQASFTIKAPADLIVEIRSQNGNISVSGFRQPVKASTALGAIKVRQQRADANLETRAGEIQLETLADKFRLVTYNGRINLDLSQAKRVDGAVVTHNGPVSIVVGDQTDAAFTCKPNNAVGKINVDTSYVKASTTRSRRSPFVGVAGQGTGKVSIETRVGDISFR